MSTADYTRYVALATRLIAKYGRAMTAVKVSRVPADAGNRHLGNTGTLISIPIFAAIVSESDLGYVVGPGGAARQMALVSAADFGSELGELFDRIENAAGDVWQIEDTEVLEPGDVRILYTFTLGARR